jgi:WD40 repeat protein
MSIAFFCPRCSKKLKAGDDFAGKRVRCSGCTNVVSVPRSGPVPQTSSPSAVPPKIPAPQRSGAPTAPPVAPGRLNPWWYVGGGGAVGLVVLCILLFAVLGRRADTKLASAGWQEVKLERDRTKIEEPPPSPATPAEPQKPRADSEVPPSKQPAPTKIDLAPPALVDEPPAKRPLVKPLPPPKQAMIPPFDFANPEKSDRLVLPVADDGPIGPVPAVWEGHTNRVRNLAWTDDGKFVLSVSGDIGVGAARGDGMTRPPDYSIRVWDASRGTQIHMLEMEEPVVGLAASPGGRLAVFGNNGIYRDGRMIEAKDRNIRMLDVLEKKQIHFPGTGDPSAPGGERPARPRFQGSDGTVFDTTFSPDRRLVASVANGNDNLFVWEAATGKLLMRGQDSTPLLGFLRGFMAIRFTPDGRQIVCSGSNRIWVYDLATGRRSAPLLSHRDLVWSLAVTQTSDGRTIAISGGGSRPDLSRSGFILGAKDYAIRLWDLDARREVRKFVGHRYDVMSLVFRPKSQQFLSASLDGTVRLWDGETGKLLRTFEGHVGAAYAVAVSPDGDFAVSGGSDCTIRRWELPPLPN